MAKLRILIVEDNPSACAAYMQHADNMEDISIVNITNSSNTALNNIKDYSPDAVILELELLQGAGNGFDVLEGIHNLSLNRLPYILITTSNSSNITHNYARKLGADFILSKNQADYTDKMPLEFLCRMKSVIQSKPEYCDLIDMDVPYKSSSIKQYISAELGYIGIQPKAVGHKYLVDAILLLINNSSDIYKSLAEKYQKTEESIKRAMQYEICRAWKSCDTMQLMSHYKAHINSSKGVPTTTELIYYYADKIRAAVH